MTLLRIAIAIVLSLVLHAAAASVIGVFGNSGFDGGARDRTVVTLMLAETPSPKTEEAAPSPAPVAGAEKPETAVPEIPAPQAAADPVPAQTASLAKAAPEPVIQDAEQTVMAVPAPEPVLPQHDHVRAQPQQSGKPSTGSETELPFELPETLAMIPVPRPEVALQKQVAPKAEPRRQSERPAPAAPQANKRVKSGKQPGSKTMEPGNTATREKPAPAARKGSNSAGNGKAATAAPSGRQIAAYGRAVNAHVARRKAAAPGRGTAALTLRINRNGALVGASLSASSGNKAIDQAALATARKASPYPKPPEGIPGGTVALKVRISFR